MARAAADPVAKAIKSARTRRLTAAKKSLKLIRDAATQHLGLLESGQLPEADFLPSAVKYTPGLAELRLLDMITEGSEQAANGTAELEPADVAALLETIRAFVPGTVLAALPQLARVAAAVAPPEPEQPAAPAPESGQEQPQP